ncbi:MAG: hypothetical protein SOW79_01015, partial [Prevotella sp.]|nr:hypothetical protein [Prevotella sp.]
YLPPQKSRTLPYCFVFQISLPLLICSLFRFDIPVPIPRLGYNLNVPIKAKDPPWFAVQMGSVADSVAAKIRIIIDNTNFLAGKNHARVEFFAYL